MLIKLSLIAVLLIMANSVFATQDSSLKNSTESQSALEKLLLNRPDPKAVGERYEGANLLTCPSGGKVSAPYFQWVADSDGLVRRLSWVKSDAPFLWVLKDNESGRNLLAFYAEVGGTYTVDHPHGNKPPDNAFVKIPFLALYEVNGSAQAPELKLRGYSRIANQGICRWPVRSDIKLVAKLSPDLIRYDDGLLNSIGLDKAREAANNSWMLVPPEAPKLTLELITVATGLPGVRVEFSDGCGTGKPMRADYELSGDVADASIRACSELPRRLDVVP